MKYSRSALLFCLALCSGSARADEAYCAANSKVNGSFFSGHQYVAVDQYPTTSQLDTFKRLNIHILKGGWRVSQADKDLGIISAAQDVQGSQGKQVNLNVVVEPFGTAGSKATMTLQMGLMQMSLGDQLKSMCQTLSETPAP